MERKSEEAALVACLDHRLHVEEIAGLDRAVLVHGDGPAPFDQEQPAAAVTCARDLRQRVEAAGLQVE